MQRRQGQSIWLWHIGFMVSPFSLNDFERYGCTVKSMRLPGLALRKGRAAGARPGILLYECQTAGRLDDSLPSFRDAPKAQAGNPWCH